MLTDTMRKLCPNLDREDGLETVLEVPIPEDMYNKMGTNSAARWHNMRSLMRPTHNSSAVLEKWAATTEAAASSYNHDQFLFLLKLVGSAFIPYPVQLDNAVSRPIKDGSIESSTARYIVQQYVAATGGFAALNAINSMYAVGQLKVEAFTDGVESCKRPSDAGGFVLWQKNPDLWYLELVISGFKVGAGSDGKVAWSQSSSSSTPVRGPPRPLRRFFQGLDPRLTANLFLDTVCICETKINDEDCFTLKLETSSDIRQAQSTPNTELVRHTIWGYFSQKTGLLVKFQDTKLIRMKSVKGDDHVYYETTMESILHDYRYVEGVNIAHAGTTAASLHRYGKNMKKRWRLEESWRIEEVGFNVCGLSPEYFMPPSEGEQDSGSI